MRSFPTLLLAFALIPLAAPAPAQAIEDAGPHLVGWRDQSFTDMNFGRGPVNGRIYYPALAAGQGAAADPGAGPYPLVGFQHGYFGSPSGYDDICTHLASWGFVVASIGTNTGPLATMQDEAGDTQALLHWVDDESHTSGAWLEGMAWDGEWAASGHSMGGGALMYLIADEPRVRTIVALQPYAGSALGGSAQGESNLAVYSGNVAVVTGELDSLQDEGFAYFNGAPASRRDLYYLVLGTGHLGPTDNPPNNEPLPGAEQQRLHRRILAGTMRAELLGEENLYSGLLGEGMAVEPVQYESLSNVPVFWAALGPFAAGSLDSGFAGRPADFMASAWSYVPASISTPAGLLGIAPGQAVPFQSAVLPGNGVTDRTLPILVMWSGRTVYLQAIRLQPGPRRLSPTIALDVP